MPSSGSGRIGCFIGSRSTQTGIAKPAFNWLSERFTRAKPADTVRVTGTIRDKSFPLTVNLPKQGAIDLASRFQAKQADAIDCTAVAEVVYKIGELRTKSNLSSDHGNWSRIVEKFIEVKQSCHRTSYESFNRKASEAGKTELSRLLHELRDDLVDMKQLVEGEKEVSLGEFCDLMVELGKAVDELSAKVEAAFAENAAIVISEKPAPASSPSPPPPLFAGFEEAQRQLKDELKLADRREKEWREKSAHADKEEDDEVPSRSASSMGDGQESRPDDLVSDPASIKELRKIQLRAQKTTTAAEVHFASPVLKRPDEAIACAREIMACMSEFRRMQPKLGASDLQQTSAELSTELTCVGAALVRRIIAADPDAARRELAREWSSVTRQFNEDYTKRAAVLVAEAGRLAKRDAKVAADGRGGPSEEAEDIELARTRLLVKLDSLFSELGAVGDTNSQLRKSNSRDENAAQCEAILRQLAKAALCVQFPSLGASLHEVRSASPQKSPFENLQTAIRDTVFADFERMNLAGDARKLDQNYRRITEQLDACAQADATAPVELRDLETLKAQCDGLTLSLQKLAENAPTSAVKTAAESALRDVEEATARAQSLLSLDQATKSLLKILKPSAPTAPEKMRRERAALGKVTEQDTSRAGLTSAELAPPAKRMPSLRFLVEAIGQGNASLLFLPASTDSFGAEHGFRLLEQSCSALASGKVSEAFHCHDRAINEMLLGIRLRPLLETVAVAPQEVLHRAIAVKAIAVSAEQEHLARFLRQEISRQTTTLFSRHKGEKLETSSVELWNKWGAEKRRDYSLLILRIHDLERQKVQLKSQITQYRSSDEDGGKNVALNIQLDRLLDGAFDIYDVLTPEERDLSFTEEVTSAAEESEAGNDLYLNYMSMAGIEKTDLSALGLSPGNAKAAYEVLIQANKSGISGVKDALSYVKDRNANLIMGDEINQNDVGSMSDATYMTGCYILYQNNIDEIKAQLGYTKGESAKSGKAAGKGLDTTDEASVEPELDINSPELIEHLREKGSAVLEGLASAEVSKLGDTLLEYEHAQDQLTELAAKTAELEERTASLRAELAQLSEGNKKLTDRLLGKDKVKGLRIAHKVIEAIELERQLSGEGSLDASSIDDLTNKRDQALRDLRNVDFGTMSTSSRRRLMRALGLASNPTMEDLKKVERIAQIVIQLRENVTSERNVIQEQIVVWAEVAQNGLNARAEILGEERQKELRKLVHLAYLTVSLGRDVRMYTYTANEGVKFGIDTMAKEHAIFKQLESWGVSTNALRPEILLEIQRPKTLSTLEQWRQDVDWQHVVWPEGTPLTMFFGSQNIDGQRAIPPAALSAVIGAIKSMTKMSKFSLGHSVGFGVATGYIPVDGAGIISAQIALAVSKVANLHVFYSVEGWYVTVGGGAGGSLSGEVAAGLTFGDHVRANFAGASVSASAEMSSGYTLSFPPTEEGRDEVIAFVTKAMSGKRMSLQDFTPATDIAKNTTRSIGVGGELYAGLRAYFYGPGEALGAGANLTVSASAKGSEKVSTSKSQNRIVTSREVERRLAAGVSTGAYVRGGNVVNMGSETAISKMNISDHSGRDSSNNQNMNFVSDSTGVLAIKTSRTKSIYVGSHLEQFDIVEMGTREHISMLEDLKKDPYMRRQMILDETLPAAIEQLSNMAEGWDVSVVLRRMTKFGRDHMSRLENMAQLAERAGKFGEARRLREIADRFAEDPANSQPFLMAVMASTWDARSKMMGGRH